MAGHLLLTEDQKIRTCDLELINAICACNLQQQYCYQVCKTVRLFVHQLCCISCLTTAKPHNLNLLNLKWHCMLCMLQWTTILNFKSVAFPFWVISPDAMQRRTKICGLDLWSCELLPSVSSQGVILPVDDTTSETVLPSVFALWCISCMSFVAPGDITSNTCHWEPGSYCNLPMSSHAGGGQTNSHREMRNICHLSTEV